MTCLLTNFHACKNLFSNSDRATEKNATLFFLRIWLRARTSSSLGRSVQTNMPVFKYVHAKYHCMKYSLSSGFWTTWLAIRLVCARKCKKRHSVETSICQMLAFSTYAKQLMFAAMNSFWGSVLNSDRLTAPQILNSNKRRFFSMYKQLKYAVGILKFINRFVSSCFQRHHFYADISIKTRTVVSVLSFVIVLLQPKRRLPKLIYQPTICFQNNIPPTELRWMSACAFIFCGFMAFGSCLSVLDRDTCQITNFDFLILEFLLNRVLRTKKVNNVYLGYHLTLTGCSVPYSALLFVVSGKLQNANRRVLKICL